MCGLTLLYRPQASPQQAQERTLSALQAMQHRGPDGQDTLAIGACWLGHVRLAIIDLAGSAQPMSATQGRWHLVFNGEIYNYRELRSALSSRWSFSTQGDSEVLLAGLSLEGPAFLHRLRGMWAACWYDQVSEEILLTRDRLGKKPLYYTQLGAGLAAASELPALRRLSGQAWDQDMDSCADYFRYGYTLPGHTFYEDVHELLPGHYLRYQGGRLDIQPYWRPGGERFAGRHDEALQHLRGLWDQALQRRMVADVEIGAFLSGGVDSSLVVSSLRRLYPDLPLKTFTIGFDDPSHDERVYARQIAQRAGTEHIEAVLAEPGPEQLQELLSAHMGQPFSDSSILPTQLVSQLASQHVKVALSGDGGDEFFCGYERYFARQFMRCYTRLPRLLQRSLEHILRSLPEPRQHHSRSLMKKAHLFLQAADRLEDETPYYAPRFYREREIARLWPGLEERGHQPPGLVAMSHLDDLGQMMLADSAIYLPQDILCKVDRASMSASLETRAPFLDADLVDFALSLPSSWHHGLRHGKRLLQAAFHDRLPDTIWRRRKQGFASPIHRWMSGQHLQKLHALARHTPLDTPLLQQMSREHQQGQRDHGYRLWLIYVYLLSMNTAGPWDKK